jgi:3-hydroxyacyl-CoA dehydrogenase
MTARVACIGAGNVGRAWAAVFARAGHEVALYDSDPAQVDRALPLIARTLDLLADGDDHAAQALSRIRPAATLAAAVTDAAHIQESVREDIDIKRAVAAEIAAHAPSDAIIASSTSALRGSGFLTDIPHPDRALVAHPVNPPSLIPLVELCGTGVTSDATLSRARYFYESLGMKPVTLRKEIDGFLLNRLQYTLVAEALHLVGEGYCDAADIDRVMTNGLALRWLSIGPFATAHLNATAGFQGFVDQLGPMMRRMGEDARTDYPWTAEQIAEIHATLSQSMPVARIADWQAWRDTRILAARKTQAQGQLDQPDSPT